MKKIELIIRMIESSVNDIKKPEYEISSEIEDFISDNFFEIDKENSEIATFLNDDVIDICEQTELGLEGTNFRKEIKEAYNKILEMLS